MVDLVLSTQYHIYVICMEFGVRSARTRLQNFDVNGKLVVFCTKNTCKDYFPFELHDFHIFLSLIFHHLSRKNGELLEMRKKQKQEFHCAHTFTFH